MRYASILWALVFTLLLSTVGFAQDRGGGPGHHPMVSKPQPPMVDYDENMWGTNKKLLFDATMAHYMRLINMSEVALQNAVSNSNLQNGNATTVANQQNTNMLLQADVGHSLSRNALLFQGVTAGAGQGRQLASADVALNRKYADTDIATAAIHAEVNRLMTAMTPIVIESVRGMLATAIEAARNPPPGSQTTGRPPVNQSGG